MAGLRRSSERAEGGHGTHPERADTQSGALISAPLVRAGCVPCPPAPHKIAPMSSGYDPKTIEAKWQQVWADERTWEVANPGQPGYEGSKPKSYVLEMLPYPSGEPHVGHSKCYAVGDAIRPFRRRTVRGDPPDGLRPFGLRPRTTRSDRRTAHARDRAIDRVLPPPVPRYVGDLDRLGAELGTHTPSTTLDAVDLPAPVRARFAYRTEAPVAVVPQRRHRARQRAGVDGRCERCGTPVRAAQAEQWFFKITEYAERLLSEFDLLESGPEHVITMQRNWIGSLRGGGGDLPLRGA